jgi:predicted phosphodiesterase
MLYNFRNDTVILLGDTHSTTTTYDILNIDIPNGSDVWHCGDGGLGFGGLEYALANAKSWLDRIDKLCQKLDIMFYHQIGNHDNPAVWQLPDKYSNVILLQSGDVGVFPNGKKTLFIGGGVSVDRFGRKENFSYWKDEITPFLENVEKTDFVFSHDAPEHFNHSTESLPKSFGWYCERDVTLIDDCLKQRLNISDIVKRSGANVIFSGHFHNDKRQEKDGVYYRCLDINERFEFDSNKTYKL